MTIYDASARYISEGH